MTAGCALLTVAMLASGALQVGSPTPADEIPKLIEQIKASYDTKSSSAVDALGRIGKPAVPALMAVLRDRTLPSHSGVDAPARCQAASALEKIGPPAAEAVPLLLEILRDRSEDDYVRWPAAAALARIGRRPAEVVSAVLDTLEEHNSSGSSARWSMVGVLADLAEHHAQSRPALAKNRKRLDRVHLLMGGGQAFARLFRALEPPSPSRVAEEGRIAEAVLRHRIKDASVLSCVGKSVSDDTLLRLADLKVTRNYRECAVPRGSAPLDVLTSVTGWLEIRAVDWLTSERVYTALQEFSSGVTPASWTDYILERREGNWVVILAEGRPSI